MCCYSWDNISNCKINLVLIENGNGQYNLPIQDTNPEESQRSQSPVVIQTTTWSGQVGSKQRTSSVTDARSVKIYVPSHGDTEETTVLMHAHENGYWHTQATVSINFYV